MMRKMAIALLACWATQIYAAEWSTDLPKALKKAKEENKLVLLDFTGSDWCSDCKQLHDTVLTSKEFQEYADKHFELVVVDFPHKAKQPKALKKANAALAQEFNVDGFPTLVVLGPDRKELKNVAGYMGENPTEYMSKLVVTGK